MRDYSKFASTFWTGPTGRQIRSEGPDAQLVAAYLLTSPHANMFGLYYLPLPFMDHEIALPPKRIRAGLATLERLNFCRYHHGTEFVWVIEMATYQIGKVNPRDHRYKGIQRAWLALPSNPFLEVFHAKYQGAWELLPRAYQGLTDGLEALTKGSGSPQIIEQEKEQEREGQRKPFQKPTPQQVEAYGVEIDYRVNGQHFVDHYEAKGWKIGSSPMKDWKAALRTWRMKEFGGGRRVEVPDRRKNVGELLMEQDSGRAH